MKTTSIILVLLLVFFSCEKKTKSNTTQKVTNFSNYEKYYNNKKKAQILADSALMYGDTNKYNQAFKSYMLLNCYEDFLYYSIKMGEKYNYSEAYFNTYYLLTIHENDSLDKLNYLAYYYLLKSYEKGNSHARYEIIEKYPNQKLIPKSSEYLINFSKH